MNKKKKILVITCIVLISLFVWSAYLYLSLPRDENEPPLVPSIILSKTSETEEKIVINVEKCDDYGEKHERAYGEKWYKYRILNGSSIYIEGDLKSIRNKTENNITWLDKDGNREISKNDRFIIYYKKHWLKKGVEFELIHDEGVGTPIDLVDD